jgi:hypothetical protein
MEQYITVTLSPKMSAMASARSQNLLLKSKTKKQTEKDMFTRNERRERNEVFYKVIIKLLNEFCIL